MEKNRFWIISLVTLSIINTFVFSNIWLKIAIGANSAIVLFNIVMEVLRARKENRNG